MIGFGKIQENNPKVQQHSTLPFSGGRAAGSVALLNQAGSSYSGYRYESTAAASDSSNAPVEKFEYQAEVLFLVLGHWNG